MTDMNNNNEPIHRDEFFSLLHRAGGMTDDDLDNIYDYGDFD